LGDPRALLRRGAIVCVSSLSLAIALLHPSAPLAQTIGASVLSADIPAQPLVQALTAFAHQTGLQIAYVSSVVGNLKTVGAPAGLSVPDALTRLLEGTGLRFAFLTPRSVQILAAEAAIPAQARRVSATVISSLPEEVLITATKRVESLATVPMSVSVLSSEAMEASGIKSIEGIAARVPGVEYDFSSQFGSGTVTNIALRGINSNTGQSTTALYLDDAPLHSWHVDTAFANPYPVTFDLARVEILRGPQGTLFGTGAEGGAIRLITNQPSTTTFDGLCQAEVATTEHGDMSLAGGVAGGGPLVKDRLGARVSAWYQRAGGFVDRVDPFTLATVDAATNRNSLAAFRAAFEFTPDEVLRITPSYNYQSLDIRDSPSFYTYLSNPGAGVLRSGKLLRQPAADEFSLASLKIEADIGAVTLTSATSYLDRTSVATVDQTNQAGVDFFNGFGNPLGAAYPTSYADAIATVLNAHQFIFSHELRLTSRDSAAPLTWVAGVFYARSRTNGTRDTYAETAPQNPGLYNVDQVVDTDVASFGDATLRLSRRWQVGLGARLEHTRSDSTDYAAGFANPVSVPFYHSVANTGDSLAPRFTVSYTPDEHTLLYASAARGFRAGGLNVPECGAPSTYAPDSVWNYETGAKNTGFNGRLQLATSIFYARWTDIQQRTSTTASCFVDYTSNVGTAVIRGFDLTADALLGGHTYLAVAIGFLDAHYTSTIIAGGKVIVAEGTAVGGLPAVPAPWSLAASAEYRLPVRWGATAYARAEEIVHSHNPGPFLEADPNSAVFTTTEFADPATKLLNLHLGMVRDGFDLKLSVINALNSQPLLQHDSDAPGSSLQYAYTFRPRTLALTGTQRF
jgi:iron complex outermembrane receptor protein